MCLSNLSNFRIAFSLQTLAFKDVIFFLTDKKLINEKSTPSVGSR